MKLNRLLLTTTMAAAVTLPAIADQRRFTYTYEPETPVAGTFEFENWITLRTQRNEAVGQDNYNRWDLRHEFEYGVTDRYAVSLYLNESAESFRDPVTKEDHSDFSWKGISIENRYNLWNPADHAVGLTLYLEGRYSGSEAELEEKIILGQRFGDWKWALNLEHATEWEDNLHEMEAELGVSFGIARDLTKNISLGLEVRNETLVPEYSEFESSAVFVGPVLSYRQERWWVALTVMPQVYGWNNDGSADRNSHLELVDHEKVNIRLIVGIDF